jgi:Class II Aldolase and Adducin N-terminal domain
LLYQRGCTCSSPLTVEGQVRDLGPDRLALVRLDGTVFEGTLDPGSAEIIAMHSEVYKARPEVDGIIRTHSPRLLAFAMAGRPLPDRYEALLRFGPAEDVPVVPWAPRGSERSVGGIIDARQAAGHADGCCSPTTGISSSARGPGGSRPADRPGRGSRSGTGRCAGLPAAPGSASRSMDSSGASPVPPAIITTGPVPSPQSQQKFPSGPRSRTGWPGTCREHPGSLATPPECPEPERPAVAPGRA